MSEQGRGRTPTISDVARAAGVSRATVSRSFGRPDMLSADTVARVRDVARLLGYVPNLVARALSTGRHCNLALVVPDIANPFFPPLIRAAEAEADRAGFSVFLGDSDEDPVREDMLVQRLCTRVDGFVLASSRLPRARILALAEHLPVVLVNRDIPGLSRVLIDTEGGIGAAAAHLAALGHRAVVYVSGPAASWSDQQRWAALQRASAANGLTIVAIPAWRPSFDAGRDAVAAVLASGATASVTFDDSVAHGLLAGLADRGLSVPRDFSVIGCDDVLGASTHPALTSISAAADEAGRRAARLLLARIDGSGREEARDVLDTTLAVRATTGVVPHPQKIRQPG